ncbi:MAG: helix-turn-helix transcriptional regulator [Oscillibacter sp.]|nr:helix-turn-helix transcriptional regulator [Oscillibacter sp.]
MTRKKAASFTTSKFSERLKQILIETNTTHQELADILGVQRQTVSLYVNGQIRPDIDTLAIIGDHYGVTADWLLGLTEDRKKHPTATDELGLSENSIHKIRNYGLNRIGGRVRTRSSLEKVISHDDFEELLENLDTAFSSCSESLRAYSCGYTEMSGEQLAIDAAKDLEGTRWTVITSAKYAQYSVYKAQQIFNRIISDISEVEKLDDIMEY